MRGIGPCMLLAAALLLGACATTPEANVVRFHSGQAMQRGTVAVVPADPALAGSLEFGVQSGAVAAQLQRQGFTPVADPAQAQFIATVEVTTGDVQRTAPRSSVSVGIGGGFSTGNVGIGSSVRVPVGNSGPNTVVTTTLSVQLKTAAGAPVWEGRASAVGANGGTPATPALASALFRDFPGTAGQSTRVPLAQPSR